MSVANVGQRSKSRTSVRSFLSDSQWFHNSIQSLQQWQGWRYLTIKSPLLKPDRSTWYVHAENNRASATVDIRYNRLQYTSILHWKCLELTKDMQSNAHVACFPHNYVLVYGQNLKQFYRLQ